MRILLMTVWPSFAMTKSLTGPWGAVSIEFPPWEKESEQMRGNALSLCYQWNGMAVCYDPLPLFQEYKEMARKWQVFLKILERICLEREKKVCVIQHFILHSPYTRSSFFFCLQNSYTTIQSQALTANHGRSIALAETFIKIEPIVKFIWVPYKDCLRILRSLMRWFTPTKAYFRWGEEINLHAKRGWMITWMAQIELSLPTFSRSRCICKYRYVNCECLRLPLKSMSNFWKWFTLGHFF